MKPCPFCGTSERDDEQPIVEAALLQLSSMPGPFYYVECFGCGVTARYADDEETAIAQWNQRTPIPD